MYRCYSRILLTLLQLHALQDASKRAPLELKFSPEVQQALQQGKPLVALESTIISHGAWDTAEIIFTHACPHSRCVHMQSAISLNCCVATLLHDVTVACAASSIN